jgi:hypothetical protein
MIIKQFCYLALAFFVAAFCWTTACVAEPTDDVLFDIAQAPDFTNYKPVLVDFLHSKKRKGAQDFCIVGYRHADQSQSAWVIWKQAGKLILWEPGDEPLLNSRRVLDLKRDVVKTEDDLHGSTYLVTRAWVKQIQADCQRAGVRTTVNAATVANKQ